MIVVTLRTLKVFSTSIFYQLKLCRCVSVDSFDAICPVLGVLVFCYFCHHTVTADKALWRGRGLWPAAAEKASQ